MEYPHLVNYGGDWMEYPHSVNSGGDWMEYPHSVNFYSRKLEELFNLKLARCWRLIMDTCVDFLKIRLMRITSCLLAVFKHLIKTARDL